LLVAARQNVVAEITLDGVLLGITSLDKSRHQQTEGVAFLSDGTLIMADEGSGRRGRLTFYSAGVDPPQPWTPRHAPDASVTC
jgi:hypothetical protein